MALSAKIVAQIVATLSGSGDLGTPEAPVSTRTLIEFADGSGSGQANKVFADQRTIGASSNESLDLAGSLVDPLGATLTFTKIKALLAKAAAGNTNNVVIGGAGSNTWVGPFGDATDTIAVKPGGVALLVAPDAAGWAVTASTGDILKIANSGGTTGVTYDIVIIGA